MLALIAAALFAIAAISRAAEWTGTAGDWLMWTLLGLAAWALHSAYPIGLPHRHTH